jgi:cellulose synthase/poly-beta-1,6-N-acetylglucosamine synthase-like glycosyltransferase
VNENLTNFHPILVWPQELASAQMAANISTYSTQAAIIKPKGPTPIGLRRDTLVSTAWQSAKATGTTLDRYLIHNELVDEDTLYHAFARVLGLPFIVEEFIVPDGLDGLSLLKSGHCPLSDPGRGVAYVVAPTSRNFEGLLQAKALGLKIFEGARVVVTTPKNFAHSVHRRYGSSIAHHVNSRMAAVAPWLSAEKLFGRVTMISAVAMVLLFGLAMLVIPEAWNLVAFGLMIFPSLPSLQFKALAMIASAGSERVHSARLDRDLPTYSVLVPIYREARIVPQLIERLKRIDYPRAKLDIKILVEIDDVETRKALDNEALSAVFEVIVCPPGKPRTKPRALNIGLAYAKGDCIVVYDAEDEPDPDQLSKAAAYFAQADPTLGCVQARLAIDNAADSWIARMFALEYAGLFDGLLPGMSLTRQPIPLGGTSNHFRRATLENCLGWDAWNVTEDADLGLRLAYLGYHCIVIDSTTWEEAPINITAWFNQRTRWLKGWMQTACVLMRHSPSRRNQISRLKQFEIAVISTSSVVSALFHPLLLLIPGLLLAPSSEMVIRSTLHLTLWSFVSCIFVVSGLLSLAIVSVGAHRRGFRLCLSDLFFVFLYSLIKTLAAWRALVEFIVAPTHWHKTEHGLARSSRHRPSRSL